MKLLQKTVWHLHLQSGRRSIVRPSPLRRLGAPRVMMVLISMTHSWKRSRTYLVRLPPGKLCLNGSRLPQGHRRHWSQSGEEGPVGGVEGGGAVESSSVMAGSIGGEGRVQSGSRSCSLGFLSSAC
jgi:hypothetical protein